MNVSKRLLVVVKTICFKFPFCNGNKDPHKKETYGFKTAHYPPQSTDLEPFETDVLNIVNVIKFKQNSFQKQLKNDLKEIKESSDLLVFADKTSNIYKMCAGDYNKLLKGNITKTYKHAPPKLEKSINLEAKHIATNLKLDDRIERLARTPAYITLKYHKENFHVNTPCRLINPCKSKIGKISKQLLEKINNQLLEKLNVNQRRDTNKVVDWFVNLKDKHNSRFIQLVIKEFYPSITERTLYKAMSFASEHTTITAETILIIKHSRKLLLFHLD